MDLKEIESKHFLLWGLWTKGLLSCPLNEIDRDPLLKTTTVLWWGSEKYEGHNR